MKDKWMNIGYEGEELQPYHEPEANLNDDIRIRKHYTVICTPTSFKLCCFDPQIHHMMLRTQEHCIHVVLQDALCAYTCHCVCTSTWMCRYRQYLKKLWSYVPDTLSFMYSYNVMMLHAASYIQGNKNSC